MIECLVMCVCVRVSLCPCVHVSMCPDLLVIFPVRFHTSFILSCVCSVRRINCCGFFCFAFGSVLPSCLFFFSLFSLTSYLLFEFGSLDPRRTEWRSWGEERILSYLVFSPSSQCVWGKNGFPMCKITFFPLGVLKGTRYHEFFKSSVSSLSDFELSLSEDDTPDSICQAFVAFYKNI